MDNMTALVEGAGAAVCATIGVLAYAVRTPSATLLAQSVHKGVSTRPAIALTFDDGPSESTPELLQILSNYGAPATFFQCGANVRRLPQVAREVAAAGHEIGNHTDTHPKLYFKSREFIYASSCPLKKLLKTPPEFVRDSSGRLMACAGSDCAKLSEGLVSWA